MVMVMLHICHAFSVIACGMVVVALSLLMRILGEALMIHSVLAFFLLKWRLACAHQLLFLKGQGQSTVALRAEMTVIKSQCLSKLRRL